MTGRARDGGDRPRRPGARDQRAQRGGPARRGPGGPRPPGRDRGKPYRPPRTVTFLYEDEDLIVLEKPPGMLTVGDGPRTALTLVKKRLAQRPGRPPHVWVVHRLDREVSGLLVFALSERAFRWLKEDLRARRIKRQYLALTEGVPRGVEGERGVIRSMLLEDAGGRVRSVQGPEIGPGPKGPGKRPAMARPAVTHYRVLGMARERAGGGADRRIDEERSRRGPPGTLGAAALLEITLDTGRKHQIRVHLAEQGAPIAGDSRYGAATDPLGRVALHAWRLELVHPGSGRTLTFESPAPAAMYRAVGMQPPPPAAPEQAQTTAPRAIRAGRPGVPDHGWDHVADWYDRLLEEGRSDHFEQVIEPGALRLLGVRPAPAMRILDVACGQGALGRRLASLGAEVTGIDVSPKLIEAAQRRAGPSERYLVADARSLDTREPPLGEFDAACCIMALMNIDPLGPALAGIARHLRPGGAFVGVILHPAFRAPRQTSWGWDPEGGADGGVQYRRVDGYLSTGQWPIVMNPGAAARGEPPITTTTFHRPIQRYVQALAAAGMLVETIEEWPSMRQSEPGPRAEAENHARREIPLLLAWRARKLRTES